MIDYLYIRPVLTIVLFFPFSWIQAQDLDIEWMQEPVHEISPGSSQSFVAQIVNRSEDISYYLSTEWDLPNGWFGMSNLQQAKSVNPIDTLIAIFRVRVPESFKMPSIRIPIRLYHKDTILVYSDMLHLNFSKIFDISIDKISGKNYIIAGEEYRAQYQLINKGNIPLTLKGNSKEFIFFNRDSLFIEPGGVEKIELKGNTPGHGELIKSKRISIHTKWTSEEIDTSINFYDRITVFPDSRYKVPDYQKIPISITGNLLMRHIGGSWRSVIQADIFGKKVLNEKRNNRLEFHLRAPDRIAYSTFGNYEEYYVYYQARNWGGKVGDQFFQLSRLTEFGRYSRGASLFVNKGNTSIEGFWGQPRFFPGLRSEWGLKTEIQRNNTTKWGGVLLRKDFAGEDSSVYIPSVFVNIDKENLSFESEMASQWDKGELSFSYFGNIHTRVKDIRFTAGLLFASAEFLGYYRNSTVINSNFLYPMDKVNISLNANYTDSNPSLDTLYISAPLSQNISGILSYRLENQSNIRFNSGYRRRKDRLRLDLFDYSEVYFRLNFNENLSTFRYRLFSEIGQTRNYKSSDDKISMLYNMGGSIEYEFFKSLSLSGHFSYLNSQRYGADQLETLFYGGSLNWTVSDWMQLYLSYQNSFTPEEFYLNQDFFALNWTSTINPSHSVSISTRYSKPRNQARNLFFGSVGYTLNLGIPYKKNDNLGSIRGVLKKSDGTPLIGVIINLNGMQTISDSEGVYSFNNLREGSYYIIPDEFSIPLGFVAKRPTPVKLELGQNENKIEDFIFVEGGSIQGRISLLSGQNKVLQYEADLDRPVYIKISNGDNKMVQACKINEEFNFSDIPPGKWGVEVLKFSIDKNLQFSQLEKSILVREGERIKIEFVAKNKMKNI